MKTIAEIIKENTNILMKAHGKDIKTAKLEVEILISFILNTSKAMIMAYGEQTLNIDLFEHFQKLMQRRLNHEPIAYIIGKKEFYTKDYFVDKNVLIPRPETEELVDIVIENLSGKENICDIGTGSGCIAITLKMLMPHLNISAIDINENVLNVAKKNASNIIGKDHGINFILLDALNYSLAQKFDVIVSNPPYIDINEKKALMPDVKNFEPHIALFAKENGLEFYKKISLMLDKYLYKGGAFFFEIGHDQQSALQNIFSNKKIIFMKDISGRVRFLIGKN